MKEINSDSKAVNKFQLRIWSKEHYGIGKNKYRTDYSGSIIEDDSKDKIMFHSAGQLLTAIEKMYKEAEKRRREKT